MKLYLIRHGETIENVKRIVMGQQPGRLSKTGVKQAKLLANHLRDYDFDIIYCSDLKRCTDTLKETKKYHPNTPVIYTKELREPYLGKWEGGEADKYLTALSNAPGSFMSKKLDEMESFGEFRKRLTKFINFIKKKHPKDKVLLVAHGGVIRMILAILQKISTRSMKSRVPIDNTSICEISITPKKTIIHCVNKIDHLNKKI